MVKKITLGLYIISSIKVNSRWIKYLNVNNKNVEILVKSKKNTYNLKLGEILLTQTGRPETI